ncbi:MAG TPA: MOSC domain-containing protein [Alphaproteobacteria bacterium]
MAHVADLRYYPLKSGRGYSVKRTQLTHDGILDDRSWMLVQDDPSHPKYRHHFSQREKGGKRLATIDTRLIPGWIGGELKAAFSALNAGVCEVDNPNAKNDPSVWRDIFIHGNPVKGLDAGDEAAAWFSNYLETPVRLMRFPDWAKDGDGKHFLRPLKPAYYDVSDHTHYADGGPLLVTNTASLAQLQPLFNGPEIEMERFRPNIVIEGLEPWEEDIAHEIQIGKHLLIEIRKPCDRCGIPTHNQMTGEAHPEQEPTRTLAKQRKGTSDENLKGVFFGQNAVVRGVGTINVGDEVKIISRKDDVHLALRNTVMGYKIAA